MTGKTLLYITISVFLLTGWSPVPGENVDGLEQEISLKRDDASPENATPDERPSVIIAQIESAILSGKLQDISKYLSRQVYINLRSEESGYYSANQASYLIRSFFELRRVLRFKFTTINESADPFATGGGVFTTGKRPKETFQIYLALSKIDNRWVVTQFNVY